MSNRRGASTFGCLFSLLLLVAVCYFGSKVGQVYWDSLQYTDTMRQTVRFAETFSDKQIRDRIVAKADSLGLPEDAKDVTVERTGRHIAVSADYVVLVELPLHNRSFHFTPHVEFDY